MISILPEFSIIWLKVPRFLACGKIQYGGTNAPENVHLLALYTFRVWLCNNIGVSSVKKITYQMIYIYFILGSGIF